MFPYFEPVNCKCTNQRNHVINNFSRRCSLVKYRQPLKNFAVVFSFIISSQLSSIKVSLIYYKLQSSNSIRKSTCALECELKSYFPNINIMNMNGEVEKLLYKRL